MRGPMIAWTVEIGLPNGHVTFDTFRAVSAENARKAARRAYPGCEIREAWHGEAYDS